MTLLSVHDFACIRHAELRSSEFTIVIGPQASGKSVLAKLLHFFNEQIAGQLDQAQMNLSIDALVERMAVMFRHQFPRSAWGRKRFRIHYSSGPYSISVLSDGRAKAGFRITPNEEFVSAYNGTLEAFRYVRARAKPSEDHRAGILPFDTFWPIHERVLQERREAMREDYVRAQLFVPAGRSFFTTLGKTAMTLGSSVVSDSLTQRFGRLITSLRDPSYPLAEEVRLLGTARSIIGGDVVLEGDRELLRSPDGRLIPLNLMSSGQQEFYPLAVSLNYARFMPEGLQVFIEEPEAHLFPSAQSELIELLVETVYSGRGQMRMLITTHSPYCLSKINNLLKAGMLAEQRPELRSAIEKVVPRRHWLTPSKLTAYGIVDGVLVPLVGEDGLIDSGYLDSISTNLADEFGDLLDVEYGNA